MIKQLLSSSYYISEQYDQSYFVEVGSTNAVYLFGQIGIESWKIIAITSLMWLYNLVLPVLVGSYFVLRFKPNLKTKHIET